MLYDRWRQIAETFRNEIALSDVASGRRWTFSNPANAAEQGSSPAEPLVFPQGNSPEFVLAVLRAWRDKKIVCPLEVGQVAPSLTEPPSGCIHLKLTSGSTGLPRVVAFKAEQLAADAENIVHSMGLRREWPNIGVISLAHSYGFS
ncbi:MAG: hypothetical protein ACK4UN_10290, partial [Limisphaerales bacterium]